MRLGRAELIDLDLDVDWDSYGAAARYDPNENIDTVGGIHIPSGANYWMPQKEVISRIESGDAFFVMGVDRKQAKVVLLAVGSA